jgi:xanthine/CO dehydrogenase XdhC/CoxF family maturation factor/CTP:molybdopterin cytidylyltransferase MocA
MSDWLDIIKLWTKSSLTGERCLLLSVVTTDGSSYRRAGACMLATSSGITAGTISAGCLEQDIIARLPELFADATSNRYQYLHYDSNAGDPIALNPGCSGKICIRVELIASDSNVDPDSDDCPLFSFIKARRSRASVLYKFQASSSTVAVEQLIEPPLRLVVFGAQRDSAPLVKLAHTLGFEVVIVDWRAALLEAVLSTADEDMSYLEVVHGRAEALQSYINDYRTAIVIMTHDYDSDKEALQITSTNCAAYVGVMGPRKRTQQMLRELNLDSSNEHSGVRYPVGLDIGAETPSQIAVSILAEVMADLSATSGRSLSVKTGPIHNMTTAIAVLAAGAGSRFGSVKQLAHWQGKTLVEHVANQALQVPQSAVAVVTGAYSEVVEDALCRLPVQRLNNPYWTSGVASSVRCAVNWARAIQAPGLLLICCDQPRITTLHMRKLIAEGACTKNIVASEYAETMGVPAYFPRTSFDELLALDGDRGAKSVIFRHADNAVAIALPEAAFDVDYPHELAHSQG